MRGFIAGAMSTLLVGGEQRGRGEVVGKSRSPCLAIRSAVAGATTTRSVAARELDMADLGFVGQRRT
jgi:hypothetical protein